MTHQSTRFLRNLLVHTLVPVLLALLSSLPAHAQVAFRAAASATVAGVTPAFRAAASATTTGTTLTITKPTGVAANDVLIAAVAVTPSTATITPPSGWTLVRRTNNTAATTNALAVYAKAAGASEPASYAWTLSGSSFTVGGIQAFTGVNTTTPVIAESGQATPSSLTHATPSIATTVANAMLVTAHAYASSGSWTPPTGMTEAYDRANGAASATGITVEGSFVLQAVAGATGAKSATASANADAGNTHILALQPAAVSLSVTKPTGVAANDVLIAAIGFGNATAAITPPSGWTLVRRMDNAATTSNSLAVYAKVAGASEPASYAWSVTGSSFTVGGIQAFSGADTTNPVNVENGQSTASSLTHATPSVTTTVANTMLVTAHAYASSGSWTPPTGMTEAYDRANGAASATGITIEGSFVLQAAAGATGAKSATASANADAGNTHILALRRTNVAPTVSMTSPANGAVFNAPASVTLTATATDSDGTISKVEFFQGSTLLATVTSAPYTFNWTGVAAGTYAITAKATDNLNAVTTSAPANITVSAANVPPTVSMTSPTSGATFTAPASVTLTATAADSDGTISKVEFFQGGTTLIATVTTAPYTFNWTNVAAGTYAITAKATDNLNAATTSSPVNITVNAAQALYFIHPDQLNTPRAITNQAQQVVWRWDNDDAFGGNVANPNPGGLAAFTFNLRFPGQYFDVETNNHYNYFRDYSPDIGRYVQSDPIGLNGGLNTYTYVGGNPLSLSDPSGEIAPALLFGLGAAFAYYEFMSGANAFYQAYASLSILASTQQAYTAASLACLTYPAGGACNAAQALQQQVNQCTANAISAGANVPGTLTNPKFPNVGGGISTPSSSNIPRNSSVR